MYFSVEPARDWQPRCVPSPLASDPHLALQESLSRGRNGFGFGGRLIDIGKAFVTVPSCLPIPISCH